VNRQRFIPLLVVAAGLLVYHNSFTGPFIFDDVDSILENPTIHRLWPLGQALSPPHGAGITVEGRPIVNLFLAINYALGGHDVWGYHALNLAVHILAGVALLGIVRRTLLQPRLRERFGESALPLALTVAILWTVHPLQTESVTYIVQRAESLMGLFYLFTLHCFIRGTESRLPGVWYSLSVAACLLGMACKEVMISAPVMVLLYDRTFISGTFREAWRRHWPLYLALAVTWILLVQLTVFAKTVPFALSNAETMGVTWWRYLLTEPGVILHYVRLSAWPRSLCLDCGWPFPWTWQNVLPPMFVIAIVLVVSMWALKRNLTWGFLSAWFFLILAPTSSFLPLNSASCEHRMYLPLAAVVTVVVFGAFTFGKHLLGARARLGRWLGWSATGAVALLLGFLTVQRNFDYRSARAIWQDTINKCPDNPRAHLNLANALSDVDRLEDAMQHYEQALRISPNFAKAHNGLGIALAQAGRIPEAIEHFEQALQIKSSFADAHYNLAHALILAGKVPEAAEHFEEVLRLKPDDAEAHYNLGNSLAALGRLPEAVTHWEQAVRLKPDFVEAENNLKTARRQTDTLEDHVGR
jgi:Flp pilus assembly protein TadD